jgi:hypothetical protein
MNKIILEFEFMVVAPIGFGESENKVADHQYFSDELGSSDSNESDEKRGKGPKDEKFRKSNLTRILSLSLVCNLIPLLTSKMLSIIVRYKLDMILLM